MSNILTTDIGRYAEVLKALSNPSRLRLFLEIVECCPPGSDPRVDGCDLPSVGELGGELDIAPSTLSHHIKELRRAGLVRCERRGQQVECSVDAETLNDLAEFFQRFTSE